MTTRGDQTRQHLLDVAEQLFASRGFQAVSLREIRITAGARNTAAMQFHFGDRDGLVDALMARHMPRIGARQQELFERMQAERRSGDRRSLVEVLVRPGAEYLTRGPGERMMMGSSETVEHQSRYAESSSRTYEELVSLRNSAVRELRTALR